MNENDSKNDDTMREDDDELVRAARRLGKGIAPGRDLWPGIAEAISNPAAADPLSPRRGWQRYFAYAAAVLLLVGGSSGVTWLVMNEAQPEHMAAQPVVGAARIPEAIAMLDETVRLREARAPGRP